MSPTAAATDNTIHIVSAAWTDLWDHIALSPRMAAQQNTLHAAKFVAGIRIIEVLRAAARLSRRR